MSSPQTTSWLLLSNQAHQWPPFWSLAWRVIQMSLRSAVKLGTIVLSLSGLVSQSPQSALDLATRNATTPAKPAWSKSSQARGTRRLFHAR
jgi:hypothetical protein